MRKKIIVLAVEWYCQYVGRQYRRKKQLEDTAKKQEAK